MIARSVSRAQGLTLARGGHWHGRYGTAPCPVCQPEARPEQNALTLADGDKALLLHCKKGGCAFRDVAVALGISSGSFKPLDPASLARREAERLAEKNKRAWQARTLWDEAMPIRGTVAEAYLRGRGITCSLPDTLRFHPEGWHGPTARRWPVMVGRVDGNAAFAVHRTYLRADGSGKAEVDKGTEKLMLGACAGGAVRLSCAPGRLVVAEGIETALSLACSMLDSFTSIWAALSTSGMAGLRLPDLPGQLTIAPDGDKAGYAAALTLGDRATRRGWHVSMFSPPEGSDFNDLLLRGLAS